MRIIQLSAIALYAEQSNQVVEVKMKMNLKDFPDLIKKLQDQVNKAAEEDKLSFQSVRDRLVEISELLLCEEESHRLRGFFYLGCLIVEMDNVLKNLETEEEENG